MQAESPSREATMVPRRSFFLRRVSAGHSDFFNSLRQSVQIAILSAYPFLTALLEEHKDIMV